MSNTRDVRRAQRQLADKLVETGVEIGAAREAQRESELAVLRAKGEIVNLRAEMRALLVLNANDRLERISAQRGLVPYVRAAGQLGEWAQAEAPHIISKLRELGLWDIAGDRPIRVGYDPDNDPEVQAAIDRGELPPSEARIAIEEVAALVIAERASMNAD